MAVLDFAFLLFLIFVGVAVVVVILAATWSAASSWPKEVALDYEVSSNPTTTLDYLADHVSPVMHEAGYSTEWDASELRYTGTHPRIWLIVLVILSFPISLLLLLAVKMSAMAGGYDGALLSKSDMLKMKVSPLDPGSRVSVVGRVGRAPLAQLTQLLAGLGKQRTPAGWYQEAAGIERYWDGENWTERTRQTIVIGPRMQHAQAKAGAQDQVEAGRSASS